MYNKVSLIGHIGTEPNLKQTSNTKTSLCTFRIATNETKKTYTGEKIVRTEWINIICWGRLAVTQHKYLKKGQLVFLEGKLQTKKSKNKDGSFSFYPEVVVSTIKVLRNPSNNSSFKSNEEGHEHYGDEEIVNVDDLENEEELEEEVHYSQE